MTEKPDGDIQLDYSDDGKGIPIQNLTRIFEPFFTTRRGQDGSGLGMHIVYNLVNQTMSGKITCNSDEGQGARFRLDIPAAIVPETAMPGQQNIAS